MHITTSRTPTSTTLNPTFAIRIPFALYFGWVTVATVANISALLVQAGFSDGLLFSAETWTVIIVIVAALIGSISALMNSSASYALVLVWAYWGILSRHLASDEWNQQFPLVILAVQILLPLLGVVSVVAVVRWLRQPVVDWASTSLRRA